MSEQLSQIGTQKYLEKKLYVYLDIISEIPVNYYNLPICQFSLLEVRTIKEFTSKFTSL